MDINKISKQNIKLVHKSLTKNQIFKCMKNMTNNKIMTMSPINNTCIHLINKDIHPLIKRFKIITNFIHKNNLLMEVNFYNKNRVWIITNWPLRKVSGKISKNLSAMKSNPQSITPKMSRNTFKMSLKATKRFIITKINNKKVIQNLNSWQILILWLITEKYCTKNIIVH